MALNQDDIQQFRNFASQALSFSLRLDDNDPLQRRVSLKLLEVAGLMKRVKVDSQPQLLLIDTTPGAPIAAAKTAKEKAA